MEKKASLRLMTGVAALAVLAVSMFTLSTAGQDKSKSKRTTMAVPRPQNQINSKPNQFETTLSQLPVVDYGAPEPRDPQEKSKRQIKNKRYDRNSSQQIEDSPNVSGRVSTSHWEQGLPALPVAQSDVILIAEITDARAYLSNDKTGIYSEFTANVEDVLMNDRGNSVRPGSSVTLEREGGAVRFPSGHVQTYIVSGQAPLQAGRRYVVFLNHTDKVFRNSVDKDANLFIVTGYELRGDRIVPIDGKNATGIGKLAFDEFDGSEVAAFLDAVRDAVARSKARMPLMDQRRVITTSSNRPANILHKMKNCKAAVVAVTTRMQ